MVRQWLPTFRSDSDHVATTTAWVCLPGLPLQYYDDDLLTTFASGIGKPVKIDSNTSLASRALYARMCVEIDLSQPLVSIDEEVFKVQYEGLHVICLNCSRYCHKTVQCHFDAPAEPLIPVEIFEPENYIEVSSDVVPSPAVPRVSPPTPPDPFGEWLVVTRQSRPPRPQPPSDGSRQIGSSSNCFAPLEVEDVPTRAATCPLKPALGDFVAVPTRKPKRVRPTEKSGSPSVVFTAGTSQPTAIAPKSVSISGGVFDVAVSNKSSLRSPMHPTSHCPAPNSSVLSSAPPSDSPVMAMVPLSVSHAPPIASAISEPRPLLPAPFNPISSSTPLLPPKPPDGRAV
ncbi:hypothetical protein Tsubulata_038723 [Turnera subulata]|uniref:DUF4283 domain-containing protein n=1 Tax=Turnera subulata TaxID=218843 RepID=A0A9Q0F0L4_9ROSI|nr:hypothetical protein Tsubulata_038723 [Turnera subulata]